MVDGGVEWLSSTTCGLRRILVGQSPDRLRHRGRKHQVLAPGRQRLENAPHGRKKTQIEHVIRFVQHQRLHAIEPQGSLLEKIQQPAGTRHDDLRPLAERQPLRLHGDTAEDGGHADAREAAERADLGADLGRQLARGGEQQHPNSLARLSDQPLEQRQREGGRFARARLGEAEDVAPFERRGDGLRLNRARLCKTGRGDPVVECLVELKSFECHFFQ